MHQIRFFVYENHDVLRCLNQIRKCECLVISALGKAHRLKPRCRVRIISHVKINVYFDRAYSSHARVHIIVTPNIRLWESWDLQT